MKITERKIVHIMSMQPESGWHSGLRIILYFFLKRVEKLAVCYCVKSKSFGDSTVMFKRVKQAFYEISTFN